MDAALEVNKAAPAIRRLNLKLQLYFCYSFPSIPVIEELKKIEQILSVSCNILF